MLYITMYVCRFAKCWKYRIVEEDDPVETEVVEVIRNVVQYTQRLLGNGTTIRYAHNCSHDASFFSYVVYKYIFHFITFV
jgi:hypothetical protein